jgi:hypothetical protein
VTVNNPGLNINRNSTCTGINTGSTTVVAYATVGGRTDACQSSPVTVNINPTCSLTNLTPTSWNVQVGDPGNQLFTATLTTSPVVGGSTTAVVNFTETDPNNAFSCTPTSDSSNPYQTTCDDMGPSGPTGAGTLNANAVVTSNGRTGICGPRTATINISPTPTPTPTPSVGPIRLKGSFISTGENANSGYEFTRPVSVVGNAAPLTFEYDPKYLIDFVELVGEALLDWIEVQ